MHVKENMFRNFQILIVLSRFLLEKPPVSFSLANEQIQYYLNLNQLSHTWMCLKRHPLTSFIQWRLEDPRVGLNLSRDSLSATNSVLSPMNIFPCFFNKIYLVSLYLCACVSVCVTCMAHMCRSPQMPGEDAGSSEQELSAVLSCWWVLRMESESLARTIITLALASQFSKLPCFSISVIFICFSYHINLPPSAYNLHPSVHVLHPIGVLCPCGMSLPLAIIHCHSTLHICFTALTMCSQLFICGFLVLAHMPVIQ